MNESPGNPVVFVGKAHPEISSSTVFMAEIELLEPMRSPLRGIHLCIGYRLRHLVKFVAGWFKLKYIFM